MKTIVSITINESVEEIDPPMLQVKIIYSDQSLDDFVSNESSKIILEKYEDFLSSDQKLFLLKHQEYEDFMADPKNLFS